MAKRSGMSIDFGSGKERGCGMKRKNGLITGVLLAIFMVSIFLMGCKQESDLEHLQKETDSGGRIGEISEEGTAHVIEGGESEQETEPGEGQAITFPEHFSETIGNVTFHMDIVAGEDLTDAFVVTAKAQMQKVNQEKAFELFYSDITAYDTHDYEEEDEYGKMAHSVTFVSPEETTLSYGPASGKLEYMERDLMPYVRNAFVTFEDARYNADLYSAETQLSFMTREEAFDAVQKNMQALDIDMETAYTGYALDHETMQSQEYYEDMDGNIDKSQYKAQWSEADDCYYLYIDRIYKGLPLYHVYNQVFGDAREIHVPFLQRHEMYALMRQGRSWWTCTKHLSCKIVFFL